MRRRSRGALGCLRICSESFAYLKHTREKYTLALFIYVKYGLSYTYMIVFTIVKSLLYFKIINKENSCMYIEIIQKNKDDI